MYHRIFVLITCIAALSGCSRTELAYRHADWLAYRWTDSLLDADRAQSEQWPVLFERVMKEHRRELLPQVVALLDKAHRQAGPGLTVDRLDCLWRETSLLIEAHARLFVPVAVQVLSGISADQIEHLSVELEERNAEYREDYLDPDPQERERGRSERFTTRIERWTNELSTEQVRLIELAVRGMPDITGDWLHYREQQQQRLLALLRTKVGPQVLHDFLNKWWVEQADREPPLVDGYLRLREDWIRMLVALDDTLDVRQRAHLLASVAELRDDLAGEIASSFDLTALTHNETNCSTLL